MLAALACLGRLNAGGALKAFSGGKEGFWSGLGHVGLSWIGSPSVSCFTLILLDDTGEPLAVAAENDTRLGMPSTNGTRTGVSVMVLLGWASGWGVWAALEKRRVGVRLVVALETPENKPLGRGVPAWEALEGLEVAALKAERMGLEGALACEISMPR